ncbi:MULTISPECIES: hypothetical protein [Brachybacterium]|uniref:hypothetical protein n=1 Tax=Brachybacterium TaxID=43668 RepID=UPI000A4082F5|nr:MULTISPECIES: hypothetical protein [Brachybacterium]
MQTARVDGQSEISAATLARFSPEERASYRGRLSCPDRTCAAAVHFRSQSVDGRPALFYSNDHVATCAEKSPETKRTVLEAEKREDEAIWNDVTELVLRLDSASITRTAIIDSDQGTAMQQGRRHDPRRGNRHTHASSIGLRPLLRRLRDDPTFRTSTMPLTLSDGTQSTVRQACTHISDYVHSNHRRIIWGPIARAPHGWINSGLWDENLPAVRIPEVHIEEVLDRAHVETFADLAQGGRNSFDFIVEGIFGETKNDTPWVTLESPNYLAILPRPVDGN